MRWTRREMLAASAGVLAGGLATAAEQAGTNKPTPPVDLLDQVKAWNSDKFAAPPTQFRQGSVQPRQLDAKAIQKTASGFTIQLPSKAPIPTPSVYQGKLYVSGGFDSKEFYCFDAISGRLVWGVDLDDDGPTAAACDDGTIVFNTESCTIFALQADTGKQMWSLWLGDPLTSTPTIAKGRVFTSYPAGGAGQQQENQKGGQAKPDRAAQPAPPCSHVLAALDLKTGKIIWQRWLDSDVMSAPVAVDDELYVSSFAGVVYKFRQADGTILSATRSRATSAPVVVGQNVYYTKRADNDNGKVEEAIAAYDRGAGRQQWEANRKEAVYLDPKVQGQSMLKNAAKALDAGNGFAGGPPQTANPTAGESNIGQGNVCTLQAFQGSRILNFQGRNFSCMGDEVVCSDPHSGKAIWTYKLEGDLKKEGGFLAAPPAAAGDHLLVVTLHGELLQIHPGQGKVVKSWKVGAPVRFQPAIEAARVYTGTQDGRVVCIDTGDARLTGWPCWGGDPAHTGLPRR